MREESFIPGGSNFHNQQFFLRGAVLETNESDLLYLVGSRSGYDFKKRDLKLRLKGFGSNMVLKGDQEWVRHGAS